MPERRHRVGHGCLQRLHRQVSDGRRRQSLAHHQVGQTHVHRYLRPLLERIVRREIDPSFVITHRLGLDEAASGYTIFNNKEDDCLKVVLKTAA